MCPLLLWIINLLTHPPSWDVSKANNKFLNKAPSGKSFFFLHPSYFFCHISFQAPYWQHLPLPLLSLTLPLSNPRVQQGKKCFCQQ